MSILRTYNLQNPDSSNVNIQLTQNGGAVVPDGRIGIGTTNPTANLHLLSSTTSEIKLQTTGAFSPAMLELKSPSNGRVDFRATTGDAAGRILYSHVDDDMRFSTKTPGGSRSEKLRITGIGSIGIGTANPNAKLEVRDGKIRAGELGATNGTTIIEGRYTDDGPHILNILGSHYSNGATILSYGMRPKSGSSGYVSSFANFSGGRTALEMWGEGAQIVTAPSQNTAIGSDLTGVAGAVMVRNNGDVTMRGTDSQYIEVATFKTTNGSTLVTNNGGALSFTPIENTNTSVIVHSTSTNPTRITFPVAGIVHINFHQDIRSGSASNSGHYDYIRFKRNGSNYLNALITSTNDIWDSIYGTATIELSANDYIELDLLTNTSINAWDDSGWSSYNFMFAPINTNR